MHSGAAGGWVSHVHSIAFVATHNFSLLHILYAHLFSSFDSAIMPPVPDSHPPMVPIC